MTHARAQGKTIHYLRSTFRAISGDAKRYGAKGVLKAVANVNKGSAPKLEGKSPHAQVGWDRDESEARGECHPERFDDPLPPLYARIRKLHGGKAGQGQRAVCTGTGAEQIKTGSACRSERIAKYNRLLAIERELG
jgi:hypothetical protein